MIKNGAFIFLLWMIFLGVHCGTENNCGELCMRQPQETLSTSFDTNSDISDGFYVTTYSISVVEEDIITSHLYSEDFTTHLKLYDGETLIAEELVTEAEYSYPGETPYWQASVVYTATHSGTYTFVVTTAEEGETGSFTIDWTIGEEEETECSSVSCDTNI